MALGVSFHPRWKEELLCRCTGGSFVLVWTSAGVYFPNQERWTDVAPRWAASEWTTIHQKLCSWCEQNGIPLIVDDISEVYAE